jgi:predicted deacetylase
MRQARFLLRFDDICPTMNWKIWTQVVDLLDEHRVRPILAVVPDNQDPKLVFGAGRPDFWNCVRRWQESGWSVALHGYQHKYETRNPGIMRIKDASEFAGLRERDQAGKIDAALAIFKREQVVADAWIAPGHSFDEVTVSLLRARGLSVIVDGFMRTPYIAADGMRWVPQQLWDFGPLSDGVWTVCFHHNVWTESELDRFRTNVRTYLPQITALQDVLEQTQRRGPTVGDRLFDRAWRMARWSRFRAVRGLFRRIAR